MAVDLSEYKEAIANAYEGRAVRDAIVAMVQAVEDALNTGSVSSLESRVTTLENHDERNDQRYELVSEKITRLDNSVYGIDEEDGLEYDVESLDTRVTALEGGSTNENDT